MIIKNLIPSSTLFVLQQYKVNRIIEYQNINIRINISVCQFRETARYGKLQSASILGSLQSLFIFYVLKGPGGYPKHFLIHHHEDHTREIRDIIVSQIFIHNEILSCYLFLSQHSWLLRTNQGDDLKLIKNEL